MSCSIRSTKIMVVVITFCLIMRLMATSVFATQQFTDALIMANHSTSLAEKGGLTGRATQRQRQRTYSFKQRRNKMNEINSSTREKPSAWDEATEAKGEKQKKAEVQAAENKKAHSKERPDDRSIIDLIRSRCDFFHSPDGIAYATIFFPDHVEHHKISSVSFRRFCVQAIFNSTGEPPSKMELNRLIDVMEAVAFYKSPTHQAHVRLARHNDNIYIDLTNNDHQVVKITPEGWSVMTAEEASDEGIKFVRSNRMAPLPIPAEGGSLEKLKDHVNIADNDEFTLFVSWLVGANQPEGPFPILLLQGEQGSGKSNIARKAVDLIDPSVMPLCSYPRSERDLAIAANRARVLSYDNLSGITPYLSDAFCRLATGGGFATRQLYSDEGEKIFNLKRPVIINGIADLVSRHDFSDRAIVITTRPIAKEDRLPEAILAQRWHKNRPGIFGALCDAISTALRNYDKVELKTYPRMADFSRWVSSAEIALPWDSGKFIEAYNRNREDIVNIGLEADLVGSSVLQIMATTGYWEGTPSNLLSKLNEITPDNIRKLKGWPKQANILSGKLRRSATFLREKNIDIEWIKSGDRKIVISRLELEMMAEDQDIDSDNKAEEHVDSAEALYKEFCGSNSNGSQENTRGEV